MRKAPARRRGHLVYLLSFKVLGGVLDVDHLDLGRLRHLLAGDLREPGGGLLGRDRLHLYSSLGVRGAKSSRLGTSLWGHPPAIAWWRREAQGSPVLPSLMVGMLAPPWVAL